MKNCVGIADLLCAYADNELPESNKQIVEDHLSICENCSSILEIYREISVSVNETNVSAPEALRIGVMNRIQSESIPREVKENKQRRQYKYILTRFAPIAACLVVGLVVWQFWGTIRGADNTALPAAAPMAPAPAPAEAAPEVAMFSENMADAPEADSQIEAAGAFGLDISQDDAENAPVPGDRMAPVDGGAGFLDSLYDGIDGFGPLDSADERLFKEAKAVITIVGDLPVVLAEHEPSPDWQYGRFGWETLYVIPISIVDILIDEVETREGFKAIFNNSYNTDNYALVLLTYGL